MTPCELRKRATVEVSANWCTGSRTPQWKILWLRILAEVIRDWGSVDKPTADRQLARALNRPNAGSKGEGIT